MNSSINDELSNLLNIFKVGGNERIKIIAICNDLVSNGELLSDLQNALRPIVEAKTFSPAQNIPSLISALLSVLKNVQYYKEVNEGRMKYVLYCVLLSVLLQFYPTVLKQIEIELLRNLYISCIDLVLLIPETVKVHKKSCLTCLGSTVKILSFVNKNKILI